MSVFKSSRRALVCHLFSLFLRLLLNLHSHNVPAIPPRGPQKEGQLGSSPTLINAQVTGILGWAKECPSEPARFLSVPWRNHRRERVEAPPVRSAKGRSSRYRFAATAIKCASANANTEMSSWKDVLCTMVAAASLTGLTLTALTYPPNKSLS